MKLQQGLEILQQLNFFLYKLTSAEKAHSLVKTAENVASFLDLSDYYNKYVGYVREYFNEILIFLLSQMDEYQQTELIQNHPYQVMRSFLNWPFQIFFMETASRSLWPYFENNNTNFNPLGSLLITISKKIMNGDLDYNYEMLFRLFLKKANSFAKREIIHSDGAEYICKNLMNSNKWNSLKGFLKDCLPTQEAVLDFIENGNMWNKHVMLSESKWDKFRSLLIEIFQTSN